MLDIVNKCLIDLNNIRLCVEYLSSQWRLLRKYYIGLVALLQ